MRGIKSLKINNLFGRIFSVNFSPLLFGNIPAIDIERSEIKGNNEDIYIYNNYMK